MAATRSSIGLRILRQPSTMQSRLCLLALCVAVPLCRVAYAAEIAGRVVGIADGDTLTVLDADRTQHKIRFAFIDAPEKRQPYGDRSKRHLSELAYGKDAKADCYKIDRCGRQVCTVYVDGQDVSLTQLDAGLAWWYRKYAHEQLTAPSRVRVSRGPSSGGSGGAMAGPGPGTS